MAECNWSDLILAADLIVAECNYSKVFYYITSKFILFYYTGFTESISIFSYINYW